MEPSLYWASTKDFTFMLTWISHTSMWKSHFYSLH